MTATLTPAGPTDGGVTWAVEIDQLVFRYARGGVRALDDVSLRIRPGEVVAIAGQNGSGKTTLAKHLIGLLRPSGGRVLVAGRDTRATPVQALAAHVGYVFQNPNHQLFATTVEGDLAFGPRNLGVPEAEIVERVEAAIRFFGLDAVRGLHPNRIAFPMRKLAAIAAVATMEPAILVLDEPSTGQDHATIDVIGGFVRRLREKGATVVCVSHDMPLVAGIADRLVVLDHGRIIADGTPRDVFADDEVMARSRLEPPPVTQVSLRLRHRTGRPPALGVPELASLLEELLPPAT